MCPVFDVMLILCMSVAAVVICTGDRIGNSNAVDTICITVEDYCQDFIHLKDQFYDASIQRMQQRIACEYYKALFTAKYMTVSYVHPTEFCAL